MAHRLATLLEKHAAAFAALGGALLLLIGMLVSRGGMLHPEAFSFLPGYLDPSRSLARHVFDPAANDFGMYQARELSYFFDWLDCHFIAFCAGSGAPHFFSLSHYLLSSAAAFALWRLASLLKVRPAGRALLVLLFLSSPMVLLGGDYFRSAKIGVAACVMFACWLYAGIVGNPREQGGQWRYACLAAAALGAGLFDRQGVFFVLVACVLQTIRFAARRQPREGMLLAIFAAVAIALHGYNHLLAPALIEHFNAYRPSFDFQTVGFHPGSSHPGRVVLFLLHGPLLPFKYAGMLLGDLPWPLVAAAWLALIASIIRTRPGRDGFRLDFRGALRLGDELWPLWFVLALMAMTALMAMHVPPVVFTEFSLVYYPLPTVAAACAGLALGLSRLPAARQPLAFAVLGALALANAAQLLDHRRDLHRGYYAAAYARGPALLVALREGSRLPPGDRARALEVLLPADTPAGARAALAAALGEQSVSAKP